MVLGTLCRLIVPFLALPSMNGMHPIREPASSSVGMAAIRSADGTALPLRYADLFHSGREAMPIQSPDRRPRSGRIARHPGRRPQPGSS